MAAQFFDQAQTEGNNHIDLGFQVLSPYQHPEEDLDEEDRDEEDDGQDRDEEDDNPTRIVMLEDDKPLSDTECNHILVRGEKAGQPCRRNVKQNGYWEAHIYGHADDHMTKSTGKR